MFGDSAALSKSIDRIEKEMREQFTLAGTKIVR
jgi:hypothetical protein